MEYYSVNIQNFWDILFSRRQFRTNKIHLDYPFLDIKGVFDQCVCAFTNSNPFVD